MLYHLMTSLPMMTCAFFSVLIMLAWRDSQLRGQRVMLCYMLTTTMLYAGHYVFFNHADRLIPYTDVVYVFANLAVYPLYLIYIIRLTTQWRSRYWWCLLPAFVGAITVVIIYARMTDEETHRFIEGYLYHEQTAGLTGLALSQAWAHTICKVVFAIEVVVTVVVGSLLIRRYDRAVDQFYADTDDKSMHNVQSILYLVLVAALMSFVANIIGRSCFADSAWLLAIPSVAFSTLLFAIGYLGLHRYFSFIDLENDRVGLFGADDTPLPDKTLAERIVEVVEKDKIYLQPNLKLEDLARIMNTNRTYVYQAINQQMGTSFNELINRKRVAYAERLMTSQSDLSVNDVAIQSGFASLSSFYRNLKKYKAN